MFIALLAASCSFVFTYLARRLALRFHVVDAPRDSRKIHTHTIPLLGGLGIGVTILSVLGGAALASHTIVDPIMLRRMVGFFFSVLILVIGGTLDDRYDLPPWVQILFPALASVCVMVTGTGIHEISSLTGSGTWKLDWWHWSTTMFGSVGRFVFPADLLTFGWLMGVTYATKTLDGLDGLVTGQTMLGALLVILLALSPRFYQPEVVIIALVILGAFAGFLPWNFFPARQFLGEAGSTLAGFSLGFLAIVSGAKVATAFMALGLPLIDFLRVIITRVRAGRSPFRGDDTHLHFQLLRLGFTQRQAVSLFWMLTVIFGLTALGLQTRGKAVLIFGLIATTLGVAFLAQVRKDLSVKRRKHIFLFMSVATIIVSLWSIAGLWRVHVEQMKTREIRLHDRVLMLELADTPAEREQGLSDRSSMRTDHGMLFVFPKPYTYTFWMPRMHFDLDVIWLQGSRVVDVVRLPAPQTSSETPARHTPVEPADRVLELVAGQAAVYGLSAGASVPELQIGHGSDKP